MFLHQQGRTHFNECSELGLISGISRKIQEQTVTSRREMHQSGTQSPGRNLSRCMECGRIDQPDSLYGQTTHQLTIIDSNTAGRIYLDALIALHELPTIDIALLWSAKSDALMLSEICGGLRLSVDLEIFWRSKDLSLIHI